MSQQIIVLSGPIGGGKTTLAKRLESEFQLSVFKTNELLLEYLGTSPPTRKKLQAAGQRLDQETGGAWLRDALMRSMGTQVDRSRSIVIDAVRIIEQVDALRSAFGARSIVHLHVTASHSTLETRYLERRRAGDPTTYAAVKKNKTEGRIELLRNYADVVIESDKNTPDDVFVRAAATIGLLNNSLSRTVDVLVGGQYGSEGKGQVADYLSKEYDLLVRVGGPNAGHTVYGEPDNFKFFHLPSGTRNSNARMMLGPGAIIYLPKLLNEISTHRVGAGKLYIDPHAVLIEEEDRENEASLKKDVASTGQGVGFATARKVLRGAKLKRGKQSELAIGPAVRFAKDAEELQPFIRSAKAVLEEAFANEWKILLEGTQGTGLSLHHGPYPYVTSRETTVAGCLADAGIAPTRVRKIIMVVRTYPIRVGGESGPLSQEISFDEVSRRSGIDRDELESREVTTTTGRQRRVGEFEWRLLREAAMLNGPTDVALTFVDYHTIKNRDARRFEQLDPATILFIEEVERVSGAKVSLISTRFHSRAIIDRRNW